MRKGKKKEWGKRGEKRKKKMRREGVLGRRLVDERSIDDETLDGKRPTRARIAVKIGKTQRARGEPVGRASESSNAKPSGCYTPRILVLVSAGNCHLLGASLVAACFPLP